MLGQGGDYLLLFINCLFTKLCSRGLYDLYQLGLIEPRCKNACHATTKALIATAKHSRKGKTRNVLRERSKLDKNDNMIATAHS